MGFKVTGQRSRSNIKIVFFSLLSENEMKGHQSQGQMSSFKVVGQGHQDQGHYLEKRSEVEVKGKVGVQGHKVKVIIRNKGQMSRSPRSNFKVKVIGKCHK